MKPQIRKVECIDAYGNAYVSTEYLLTCKFCGDKYFARKINAKFCSVNCRVLSHLHGKKKINILAGNESPTSDIKGSTRTRKQGKGSKKISGDK